MVNVTFLTINILLVMSIKCLVKSSQQELSTESVILRQGEQM